MGGLSAAALALDVAERGPVLALAGGEGGVHDQAQNLAGGGRVEQGGAPGLREVEQEADGGDAQDARQRACRVAQAQQRARILGGQVLHQQG